MRRNHSSQYTALLAALVALLPQSALAQNRFEPIIQVGDGYITRHQFDQRVLFLSLLNAPGDPRNLARTQLVNEAIQARTARGAGFQLSIEELTAQQEQFAARANLPLDDFITALGQNGVQPETFRDFIFFVFAFLFVFDCVL